MPTQIGLQTETVGFSSLPNYSLELLLAKVLSDAGRLRTRAVSGVWGIPLRSSEITAAHYQSNAGPES
jgi:hypothetical protein